jgi:hypothetical protein
VKPSSTFLTVWCRDQDLTRVHEWLCNPIRAAIVLEIPEVRLRKMSRSSFVSQVKSLLSRSGDAADTREETESDTSHPSAKNLDEDYSDAPDDQEIDHQPPQMNPLPAQETLGPAQGQGSGCGHGQRGT